MRRGSSPISRLRAHTVSIGTHAPQTLQSSRKPTGRPARHRHHTCIGSRMQRDRRTLDWRSALRKPQGGGHACARQSATRQHTFGARAARAAESLQPPPHGYALPRPPCPSTPAGNLRRSTVADHNRRLALPQSSRSPYGDYAFGDPEAHTRHRGAQGPENRQIRRRRTAVGLAVAARAGGCGWPRALRRG